MTYDVAVIGGGLAGGMAATTLASRGWKVALLESKRYPHHKVCGEFISPEGVRRLAALGVLNNLESVCIDRAAITTPYGDCWETPMPGAGIGISRYTLDPALASRAEAAGADVETGVTVTRIDGDYKRGFRLVAQRDGQPTEWCARAVIGAHGKRSQVDRALERRFMQRDHRFIGLKAHFVGPSPGRVDLHTFPGGYCGISEIENGRVNVCLLVRTEVFGRCGDIPAFVAWMRTQNRALDWWLAGAEQVTDWLSISQIAFDPKPPVERGVLMAGDSAGLIAPLAGDGMSMALDGGRLAALHASAYLSGDMTSDELVRRYAVAWRDMFAARLRLGRWLQGWMLRPYALRAGLKVVRHLPSLGRIFVEGTRDARYRRDEVLH
jgi:menaquinone-9 beta-reductase